MELAKLNALPASVLSELSGVVGDSLLADSDGEAELTAFAERVGAKPRALAAPVAQLRALFESHVRLQSQAAAIGRDLGAKGMDEEHVAAVLDTWTRLRGDLTARQLEMTFMMDALVDMEWDFGVSSSTSELEGVGSTFLRLKMVLDRGSHRESVYCEMSVAQFYQFLHEMERAKAALESSS